MKRTSEGGGERESASQSACACLRAPNRLGMGRGGDRFSQAEQVRDVPSLLVAVSVLLSSSLDILQRIGAASLRPDEELSSWLVAITLYDVDDQIVYS